MDCARDDRGRDGGGIHHLFLGKLGLEYRLYGPIPPFFLLPVTLFLSGMRIECPAPDAEGQRSDKVIEAVHNRSGKINGMVAPLKLMATK